MTSLFAELRRRNVFRVGVAYIVLGWLVIQITDTVAPALRLPDWTLSLVTWLGVVGFPFALLLAWAFELTPEGIKRSEDVAPEESVTRETGSRLNHVTLALMAAVILVLLADRFWIQGDAETAAATASPSGIESDARAAGIPPAKLDSIAVLPFVNMSDDRENQYFGDGLAEELLNQLAGMPGLRVAARTSSFHFRDKNPTIVEVAEALDVATVLEGSVQRSGDTIRVVAQLIRASDSAHLWSEKYDRPLDDYFDVQDDIANHIIRALMPHLAGEAPTLPSSDTEQISPELFERFLWARRRYYDGTAAAVAEAHEAFLVITRSAPDFSPGWAWLARSWRSLATEMGGETPTDLARRNARMAIETALQLNPDGALAIFVQGQLQGDLGDPALAELSFRRAVELDPLLVDALVSLQYLLADSGRAEDAIAMLQRAQRVDPLHPNVLWALAHLQNLQGRQREAFETLEKLYAINPALAGQLEAHLYSDSKEVARDINRSELLMRENPEFGDAFSKDWNALGYVTTGLHAEPRIRGTVFEPLALAVMGRDQQARAVLAQYKTQTGEHFLATFATSLAHIALDEPDAAQQMLWEKWVGPANRSFGRQFHEMEGMPLIMLLQRAGEQEKAAELLAAMGESLADMSPLHEGWFLWNRAMYKHFSGDGDGALDDLRVLAENGYSGRWDLGMLEPYLGSLRDNPRWQPIMARIQANHAGEMAELERLRNSGMSAQELRAEYLAQLGD